MRFLKVLLVASLTFSAVTGVGLPVDAASAITEGSVVTADAQSYATEIVNAQIIKNTAVSVDGQAYTVSEVQITSVIKGGLEGRVLVEVPGGVTANGDQVIVSHQPLLEPGDQVQLALVPSDRPEIAAAVDEIWQLPVYAVVHGMDGASAAPGVLQSQADAFGDYALTGSSFSSFPVDYKVNPRGSGLGGGDTAVAVIRGFQIWEDDPGSNIDMTYTGTTTRGGGLGDGVNNIYWTTPPASQGYLAQATWTVGSSGNVAFDIKFSTRYNWSNGASPGRWDIATVMLHEAGHVLGLQHVQVSSEIMFPSIFSSRVKGLGAGDRSGVAALYPAPAEITSPVSGATLNCGTVVFQWSGPSSGTYSIIVGSTNGGGEYAHLSVGSNLGYPVHTILPGNSIVYFKLLHRPVGSSSYTLQDSAVYETCPPPPSGFFDVARNSYYEDAVIWAVGNGITNGTSTTTFSPSNTVTRAQMATFLWRYAGEPAPTIANPFVDVPSGVFYTDAVTWLAETGITTGTSTNTFSPNSGLSRAQLALMLWRYAGEPAPSQGHPFSDVPGGALFEQAVAWLAETGVTTGTTATTFSPSSTLLRAQAVTFLHRYEQLPG